MRRKTNRRQIKPRIRIIRYNERMRRSKRSEKIVHASDEFDGLQLDGTGDPDSDELWITHEEKPDLPFIRQPERETVCEFMKRESVNGMDVLWPYDIYTFKESWTDFRNQRHERTKEIYCKEFDGAHDIVSFLKTVGKTSPMLASTNFGRTYYREAGSGSSQVFMKCLEGNNEFR